MTRKTLGQRILLFIIGTAVNLVLFCLSKYAGCPLWADFTGAFLIAAGCGPVMGVISVLLHTGLLTILIDGTAALLLAPAILAAVTLIGLSAMKGSFETPSGLIICAFASTSIASVLNFLCFLIFGMTGRYAIYTTAYTALHESVGKLIGSLLLSVGITGAEFIFSFIILLILIMLVPKKRDGLSFK